MPCKVSLAPRAARPSAPPAPLLGTHPWQDGAAQAQVEDPSCFALGWVQGPSLAVTVQRGRVSLWDTSLMITSVVCCSGHNALAPAWGCPSKCWALTPSVSPQRRQHWDRAPWDPWCTGGSVRHCRGAAICWGWQEPFRGLQTVPHGPCPSLFSSAQSPQCDGQPHARMCLHTAGMTQFHPANISEHWHNGVPPQRLLSIPSGKTAA